MPSKTKHINKYEIGDAVRYKNAKYIIVNIQRAKVNGVWEEYDEYWLSVYGTEKGGKYEKAFPDSFKPIK